LETGEDELFHIRVQNIYGDNPRWGEWINLHDNITFWADSPSLENAASIRVHNGNLYVTDYVDRTQSLIDPLIPYLDFRCRIFQITPDGIGTLLYGSNGLLGREEKGFLIGHIMDGNREPTQQLATLRYPNDLAFVGDIIYVSDGYHNRIAKLLPSTMGVRNGRQYTKTGQVANVAGAPPIYDNNFARFQTNTLLQILDGRATLEDHVGNKDGIGEQAKFNNVIGMVAVADSLYVVDNRNDRIRKIHTLEYAIGEKAKVQAVKNVVNRRLGLNSSMGATGIPKRVYAFAGIAAPPTGSYAGGKRTAKARSRARVTRKQRAL
jgi:hypothetical protein